MKAYKANGNDSIEMDIPEEMLEYAKEAHEKWSKLLLRLMMIA